MVGVAYLSVADGDIRKTNDQGDTFALRAGDEIYADDLLTTTSGSRAELQLDPGNFLRLSANTRLRVTQLGNRYYQFQLEAGHVRI